MNAVDRGRSGIDWDTYEGLAVQIGILSYTALVLVTLLAALVFSWAFFAAIAWFSKGAFSGVSDPVPDSPGASRPARVINWVLNSGNTAIIYIFSMGWYASLLRLFTRHLMPITFAALVGVLVYWLSIGLAFDYLYCVADDRAEPQFQCVPAEEQRVAPFRVFDRVIDSAVSG